MSTHPTRLVPAALLACALACADTRESSPGLVAPPDDAPPPVAHPEPSLDELATSYESLRRMTPQPVYAEPQLLGLCRMVTKELDGPHAARSRRHRATRSNRRLRRTARDRSRHRVRQAPH